MTDRCRRAFEIAAADGFTRHALPLVAAGGVAANKRLRSALDALAREYGTTLVCPPPALCSDNAAMIAWAGAVHFARGHRDALDVAARARWPLDGESTPVLGAGKQGAKA